MERAKESVELIQVFRRMHLTLGKGEVIWIVTQNAENPADIIPIASIAKDEKGNMELQMSPFFSAAPQKLTNKVIYLGRDHQAEAQACTSVSRDHCSVVLTKDGSVKIEDFNTPNGTFIGRERLNPPTSNRKLFLALAAIISGAAAATALVLSGTEWLEAPTQKVRVAPPPKSPSQPASVIVDSNLTKAEALAGSPCLIPKSVMDRQSLVTVQYWGLSKEGEPDAQIHQGQILVDESRVDEVKTIFQVAFDSRFPIHSVIPVSQFGWHDAKSMEANNSSAFNYRGVGSGLTCPTQKVDGTWKASNHAGVSEGVVAIDINDVQNPYCHQNTCEPSGATYNEAAPGTLTAQSPIIKVATAPKGSSVVVPLCSGLEWDCSPQNEVRTGLGWQWGGVWKNKDYQHLQVTGE